MGKARPRQRQARAGTNKSGWKSWPVVGAVLAGLAIAGLIGYQVTRSTTTVSAEGAELAAANAGGDVRALTGSRHTVFHSEAGLPSASAPRQDGKPTLVWFSGTWCEYCAEMEPFAHATAAEFRDRMVFVEKSVDDDREAALRYGVRGTPTFVLIDSKGKAIGRFGFASTPAAFSEAITAVLAQVPA